MNRLWVRMTVAVMAVALIAVVLFGLTVGRTLESRFRGYVGRQINEAATQQITESLSEYYVRQGSWAGIGSRSGEIVGQGQGGQGRGMGGGMGHGTGMGAMMGGVTYTLFDADGAYVTGSDSLRDPDPATQMELDRAEPLEVNGQLVGWLLVQSSGQVLLDAAQAQFLQQVQQTMVLVALLVSALALVVGVAISQFITRPLGRLTSAAQAVAAGKLGEQVVVPAGQAAEITTLARSFNRMSGALAKAEAQRQRLTADVAHELRTPISVMRAQLQAMLDGVHPTDPAHVAVVYEQTLHLSRLVDDLHTLTRAETGHLPLQMQPLDPASLANRVAALFEPLAKDAGLSLGVSVAPDLPRINADGDRLHQVLANLLANALRHTPTGGDIRLSVARADGDVRFSVANSGASLTPAQAEHVFERFWRADDSRHRDSGGAGLGLAIARELVHLHGGRIWVDVEDGEARFIFQIPTIGEAAGIQR